MFRKHGILYNSYQEYKLDNRLNRQINRKRNREIEMETRAYVKREKERGRLRWNP